LIPLMLETFTEDTMRKINTILNILLLLICTGFIAVTAYSYFGLSRLTAVEFVLIISFGSTLLILQSVQVLRQPHEFLFHRKREGAGVLRVITFMGMAISILCILLIFVFNPPKVLMLIGVLSAIILFSKSLKDLLNQPSK
jgi:hypothetical protein